MKNKTLTIGAAALTAVIVTTGFAFSSFAAQGNSSTEVVNNTPKVQAVDTAAIESTSRRSGGNACTMAKVKSCGGCQYAERKGAGVKGQNAGGNFTDANRDGVCDKKQ